MYRFEPLTLAHQEPVQAKLQKRQLPLSEYQFANLYLFRKVHRYEISLGELSFIRGVTYDGVRHLIPLDPLVGDLALYRTIMGQERAIIYPLPDDEAARFRGQFTLEEKEEDRDYLYRVETMAAFPGRNLASRRNLVKQFNEQTDHRQEPLHVHNRDQAMRLLDQLGAAKDDIEECREALSLFQELSLEGLLVYSVDKPIAFIIGSPLTKSCYLFHFAKALPGYKGLHQFLYQSFAKTLSQTYTHWINLEQDKGVKGLRQAKRAYEPDAMGNKWRVELNV